MPISQEQLISITKALATTAAILPLFGFGVSASALAATVKAAKAEDLLNTMCINTQFRYLDTVYGSNYNGVKQKLVDLSIRHIRDSGNGDDWISKMNDLHKTGGIKVTRRM